MKKIDVINIKGCGIMLYEHVKSFVGVDKIYKDYPYVWVNENETNAWSNVHLVFMNSLRNIPYGGKRFREFDITVMYFFNLDEVLTG